MHKISLKVVYIFTLIWTILKKKNDVQIKNQHCHLSFKIHNCSVLANVPWSNICTYKNMNHVLRLCDLKNKNKLIYD